MFDWMRKTPRPAEDETAGGVLRAGPDVRAVAADDGLAVFDMAHGGVFRSNAVGAEIWRELIERQRDQESVAEDIAGRFGISMERARQDVAGFIDQLRRQKLVTTR